MNRLKLIITLLAAISQAAGAQAHGEEGQSARPMQSLPDGGSLDGVYLHNPQSFTGFRDHKTSVAVSTLNARFVEECNRDGCRAFESDERIPDQVQAAFSRLSLEEKLEFITYRMRAEWPRSDRWMRQLASRPYPGIETTIAKMVRAVKTEHEYLFTMINTVHRLVLVMTLRCTSELRESMGVAIRALSDNVSVGETLVPDILDAMNCPTG
jgi:hypothetical protein